MTDRPTDRPTVKEAFTKCEWEFEQHAHGPTFIKQTVYDGAAFWLRVEFEENGDAPSYGFLRHQSNTLRVPYPHSIRYTERAQLEACRRGALSRMFGQTDSRRARRELFRILEELGMFPSGAYLLDGVALSDFSCE